MLAIRKEPRTIIRGNVVERRCWRVASVISTTLSPALPYQYGAIAIATSPAAAANV